MTAETLDIETQNPVYDWSAVHEDQVLHVIEKANRRLERFGITERFEATIEKYVKEKIDSLTGLKSFEERIKVEISTPSIAYEGYRFIALIERSDSDKDSFIVRTARDAELDGWRPDSMYCDHCKRSQSRAKTFVVRHEDSDDLIQLGSSCVKGYLGVRPEGLWAIGADIMEKVDEEFSSSPSFSPLDEVEEVLAIALNETNDGNGYVSARSYDGVPTVSTVSEILHPSSRLKQAERTALNARRADAQVRREDARAFKAQLSEITEANDWMQNIKTIAEGDYVSSRNLGLLVSSVVILRKEKERKIREAAPKSIGYIGEIGEPVKGLEVLVEGLRFFPGFNHYTGYEETRTMVKLRDNDGKIAVWWTTSDVDEELEGKTVTLSGGRVKNHDHYRGDDQTILTRVKFATTE